MGIFLAQFTIARFRSNTTYAVVIARAIVEIALGACPHIIADALPMAGHLCVGYALGTLVIERPMATLVA